MWAQFDPVQREVAPSRRPGPDRGTRTRAGRRAPSGAGHAAAHPAAAGAAATGAPASTTQKAGSRDCAATGRPEASGRTGSRAQTRIFTIAATAAAAGCPSRRLLP